MYKRTYPVVILVVALLSIIGAVVWACDPPIIIIHGPKTDATVSGTTPIQVDVKEGIEVTGIDIYLDGKLLAALTSAPYTYKWDTTKTADGPHKLRAVGHLKDGTDSKSKRVRVTVKKNPKGS